MKYLLKVALATVLVFVAMVGITLLFGVVGQQAMILKYQDVNQSSNNSLATAIHHMEETSGGSADYEAIINSLPLYDFQNITLVNKNGAVVYSTETGIKESYISSLGDLGKRAFNKDEGSAFKVGDNEYFISAKIEGWEYRVVNMLDPQKSIQSYNQIAFINIVQIFFIIACGCVYAVVLYNVYRRRYNQVYKVKAVNNYILTINSHGKILDYDKQFAKKYGIRNLHDCLKDTEQIFEDELYSGRPLKFVVPDKENITQQLTFTATAGMACYKLVGGEDQEFLTRYDEYELEHCTDALTGVTNEVLFDKVWEKYVNNGDFSAGLIAVFDVVSAKYYRLLIGTTMFDKWYKKVYSNIKNKLASYGSLYFKNGYVLLFVNEKEAKAEFLKNLKHIHEEINEVVELGTFISKPNIVYGVITLDKMTKKTTIEQVLSTAQIALTNASLNNGTSYYYLRTDDFTHTNYAKATKKEIEDLLKNDLIVPWFQPQVDVNTGKVVAFEELLRVVGDTGEPNEIKISQFIEAANNSGCLIELGEMIYKKSMDFAEELKNYNVSVSINVSSTELLHNGYLDNFLAEYKRHKLKAGSISVEILESAAIYSKDEMLQKLDVLRKNGIRIEIDDFGTGYSSIEYLKEMQTDSIKIDKMFIDGIVEKEENKKLLGNIIQLIKDQKRKVICEGVETKEQVEIIKELGGDVIQGYYYSKALPKEKAFLYMKEKNDTNEN